jgi:signal transduction protein with GAF and PtsI domain
MRDLNAFRENALFALERLAGDAALEAGPEPALWAVTRMLPSLLGDPAPARSAGELPRQADPTSACAAFMVTPDRKHHLITAPVNFAPEQYHEKVAIALGHPGHVAETRRALLLRDTSHYQSFVKILQTFRAGSALQVPMLWKNEYLGVLICANAVRNAFSEVDLRVMQAFAGFAASLWIAHGGPAWLETLDYDKLPERTKGS